MVSRPNNVSCAAVVLVLVIIVIAVVVMAVLVVVVVVVVVAVVSKTRICCSTISNTDQVKCFETSMDTGGAWPNVSDAIIRNTLKRQVNVDHRPRLLEGRQNPQISFPPY